MFRFVIAALIALSSPVLAQMPDELARAEIDPGWRDGDVHVAGLTIQMAPGWKTYWRAPGDAGIPPAFNWSGSDNLSGVAVQFPVPRVFLQNGMQSIGYERAVTFPLWVRPVNPDEPVRLRGEIDIGVCQDVCVLVRLNVAADLPSEGARGQALAALLEDRPETGGPMSCDIAPISDGLRLSVETSLQGMSNDMVAVIEAGHPDIWVSAPVLRRKGSRLMAEVEMVAPSAEPFALARSDVRMTVLDGRRAVEMVGCN